MKKTRITVALILILTLMPLIPAVAMDTSAISLEELSDYKKLKAFGVIKEEDDLGDFETVSRGLFMTYVVRCCKNLSEDLDMSVIESPYNDVTDETVGRNAIVMAQQIGLIDGGGNSFFRPDDDIKQEEAAKILCNLLHYGEVAKNSGGYPDGYKAVAIDLGLFNGCVFNKDGSLTPEGLIKILMNTMESKALKIESITQKDGRLVKKYESSENETVLNYVFEIYSDKGIMDSNGYTSFDGPASVCENYVTIDGNPYNAGETNVHEYIGYFCKLYYKYDKQSDEKNIIYIEAPENKNNAVTVYSEDIIAEGVSTSSFEYYDVDKEKNRKLDISKAAVMLYNGVQKRISKEALCPENGSVTLIDNDGNGEIDVVRVMNYRTILVGKKSDSSYSITDLLGGESIRLDPDEDDYRVFMSNGENVISFDEIKVRDIISYAESENNAVNLKYVRLCTDKVTGTVQATSDERVKINGEEYKVFKSLQNDIFVGEEGVFYLDFTGKIVAKKSEKDVVYGYLNNLWKDYETGETVKAQIFTENNRWVELEFKEKFKFNGTSSNAAMFYNNCVNSGDFRQLVTYTVNSEGKINAMNFAQSFKKWSDEEKNATEQNVFRLSASLSGASYRSSLNSFGNAVVLSNDTKIFMIPKQADGENAPKEDFYMLSADSLLADRYYSNIYAYDMDKTRCARACVLIGNPRMIQGSSNVMLIQKTLRALNADDEAVTAFYGMYKGYMLTLCLKDDSVLEGIGELGEGDIIQFALDEDGSICNLDLCYDYIKDDEKDTITESLYHTSGKICGQVYYADDSNRFILDVANDEDEKAVLTANSSTVVYVYNTDENEITIGDLSDIETGKRVFARTRYYVANEIVVYR